MFLRNFISDQNDNDMQGRFEAYKKLMGDYSTITQESFTQIAQAYLIGNVPSAVNEYTTYLQRISTLMGQAFKLNMEVAQGSMAGVQQTLQSFKSAHQDMAKNIPQPKDMQKMMEKGGFVINKVQSPLAFAASLAAMFNGGSSSAMQETVSVKAASPEVKSKPKAAKKVSAGKSKTVKKS